MSNYATELEGANLIDFSSEQEGCNANHVLDPHLSNIWLSEEGLPQWLCISLDGVNEKRDLVIRSIGWHCWQPYTTNPREVTIHVSSDGAKFKIWDTFQAQLVKGTQLFCCAPISASIYPYIALEVTQTFGGPQTYMNRVYMCAEELNTTTPQAVPSSSSRSSSSVASPFRGPQLMNDSYYRRSSPTRSHLQSYSHSPASRSMQQQGGGNQSTTHEDPRRSHDSDENRDNRAIAHKLDTALGLGLHGTGCDCSFFFPSKGEMGGEKEGESTGLESRLETIERAPGVRSCSEVTATIGAVTRVGKDRVEPGQVVGVTSEERLLHLEGRVSQLLSTLESFTISASPNGSATTAVPDVNNRQQDLGMSGREHESRFSRAMESIAALVTNVLERVERRHALAVQVAVEAGTDVSPTEANSRVACPRSKFPEVVALDVAELRAEYFGRHDAQLNTAPRLLLSLNSQSSSEGISAHTSSPPRPPAFAVLDNVAAATPQVADIISRLHEAVRQRAYKALQLEMLLQGGVHFETVDRRAPLIPQSRCGLGENPPGWRVHRSGSRNHPRALSPAYSRQTQSAVLKKRSR